MLSVIIILLMLGLVLFVAGYSDSTEQTSPMYRLQLTALKLIGLMSFSALLGFFTDRDSLAIDGPCFLFRHFTFSIPLFLILFMSSIYFLKLKNRGGISMLGFFFGFCCMVLTLATHLGERDPWFGLAFVIGVIPAFLVGGGFGLYLSFQVKEENTETKKRRLIWFIYKRGELWSSKA